jgi:hypothetical protein
VDRIPSNRGFGSTLHVVENNGEKPCSSSSCRKTPMAKGLIRPPPIGRAFLNRSRRFSQGRDAGGTLFEITRLYTIHDESPE